MRDTERAVVGLAIHNPDTLPTILTRIKPEDVWDPLARAALSAAIDLWGAGEQIDALGVARHIGQAHTTAMDIYGLTERACLPTALPRHLEAIATAASTRRLSQAGQRIHQLAESGEDPAHVVQHAEELLANAVRVDEHSTTTLGEAMPEAIERVMAAARGEKDTGLPTGFTDLDDMLHGLAGGQMIVVGARPGWGKTTLATDFMRHASLKLGVPSLMFSLEMGKQELATRVIAAESSVSMGKMTGGNIDQADAEKIYATRDRLDAAPFYIDDTPGATASDILAKARLYTQHRGVGLIVVDYLQLLRAENIFSREQELAGYSRSMKMLAKQTGVPVVVVVQLNREVSKRGGPPKISDIRESGAIEQDADVIMLLDRPDAEDPDSARAGEMDVIVAKNRRGRTGTVTLAAQLQYSRFRSLARNIG